MRAASTDFLDPLSPLVPTVHHSNVKSKIFSYLLVNNQHIASHVKKHGSGFFYSPIDEVKNIFELHISLCFSLTKNDIISHLITSSDPQLIS